MASYHVSLNDTPELNTAEHFTEAAQALVDRYPGALTADRADDDLVRRLHETGERS